MLISYTIENMVMFSKLENQLIRVMEHLQQKPNYTYSFTNCIHPFTVKLDN